MTQPAQQPTSFHILDMQSKAIKRIQEYSNLLHGESFYFADSFGKDSSVVRDLLIRSGVSFETHHNITSCDPPELLRFGFKNHPEVIIHKPVKTMYQLIEKKGVPPTRMVAYCCDYLKERGGSGRFVVTGVRADESAKRATRQVAETCYRDPTKRYLNPIIDWSCGSVTGDPIGDVWEYIHAFNIPYCSLYDEGMTRIGCPLCPKASIKNRLWEIKRFPMKARGYLRCFRRALLIPHPTHKIQFQTEYDMLCWYVFGKKLCEVSNEKAEIIMGIGEL